MNGCDGCVHRDSCGYFDCEDYDLTEWDNKRLTLRGNLNDPNNFRTETSLVNNFEQPACINCSNNPKNGGNGICSCTLGQINIT